MSARKFFGAVGTDMLRAAATAGAGIVVAEGVRRAMPEFQAHSGGITMNALVRFLGQKPGAPLAAMARSHQNAVLLGFGHLIFHHAGHWYFAIHTQAAKKGSLANAFSSDNEAPSGGAVLTIRALTGGRGGLNKLIRDAVDALRVTLPTGSSSIYNWENEWKYLENKAPRPLSTVAIDGDLAETLLADMRGFLADEAWYTRLHVPYRRGYLLHGPAGSGKTTLAGSLAAEAGLNICILSLADPTLNDTTFVQALRDMPKKSILLLEDVDAVNAQTERRTPEHEGWATLPDDEHVDEELRGARIWAHHPAGKLTLAGILNALDGLTTPSGLIVVMTTNHRARLDPALIRPGRVDFHAHIGLATRAQATDLFSRFFPERPELIPVFAATIPERELSPAAIQEHLVRHRFDPEGAARGMDVPVRGAKVNP